MVIDQTQLQCDLCEVIDVDANFISGKDRQGVWRDVCESCAEKKHLGVCVRCDNLETHDNLVGGICAKCRSEMSITKTIYPRKK